VQMWERFLLINILLWGIAEMVLNFIIKEIAVKYGEVCLPRLYFQFYSVFLVGSFSSTKFEPLCFLIKMLCSN
jgi:hypothetical protein